VTLEEAFAWMIGLPANALYAAAFAFAAIENVFPPFPADAFVALCAFVANPGEASLVLTFGSVVIGNVLGASITYGLGRRYGAAGLHRRLEARGLVRKEEKIERLYERYGLVAIFLARMIPGVRGIVPPFAGAMRISAVWTHVVIAMASVVWYGFVTLLAYRAGDDWRAFVSQIARLGKMGAGVSLLLVLAFAGLVWWLVRRRRQAGQ
jgi:membrane protein DedA with SNARE-associated domain